MKRTKVWIFILAFVVVYIVGMLLSWLMIKSIDEYVVNGKVATEYARIDRIADIYSELKGLGTDDDAIRKVVGYRKHYIDFCKLSCCFRRSRESMPQDTERSEIISINKYKAITRATIEQTKPATALLLST